MRKFLLVMCFLFLLMANILSEENDPVTEIEDARAKVDWIEGGFEQELPFTNDEIERTKDNQTDDTFSDPEIQLDEVDIDDVVREKSELESDLNDGEIEAENLESELINLFKTFANTALQSFIDAKEAYINGTMSYEDVLNKLIEFQNYILQIEKLEEFFDRNHATYEKILRLIRVWTYLLEKYRILKSDKLDLINEILSKIVIVKNKINELEAEYESETDETKKAEILAKITALASKLEEIQEKFNEIFNTFFPEFLRTVFDQRFVKWLCYRDQLSLLDDDLNRIGRLIYLYGLLKNALIALYNDIVSEIAIFSNQLTIEENKEFRDEGKIERLKKLIQLLKDYKEIIEGQIEEVKKRIEEKNQEWEDKHKQKLPPPDSDDDETELPPIPEVPPEPEDDETEDDFEFPEITDQDEIELREYLEYLEGWLKSEKEKEGEEYDPEMIQKIEDEIEKVKAKIAEAEMDKINKANEEEEAEKEARRKLYEELEKLRDLLRELTEML